MTSRIQLALAACEGLTDEELAKRGAGSFAKMINRKRQYAAAARTLKAASDVMGNELALTIKQMEKAQSDLAKAQSTVATMDMLDAPITDTSQADAMLAKALGKPVTE